MATGEVVLVDCRTCGGPNHPARTRCGRCREPLGTAAVLDAVDADPTEAMAGFDVSRRPADQDTPPVPVRPRQEPSTSAKVVDLLRGTTPGDTQPLDVPTPEVLEPRSLNARPVLLVTVAGLALGIVVGVVGAIGVAGRDDPVDAVGTVAFDPQRYPQDPTGQVVVEVTATSFLPPAGDNTYGPLLVLDGDPATAWNSDGSVREDGVGEAMTVVLAEPAWVTSLEIANGYQKDDVRFLANARLARATLVFDDGAQVNIVLLDQTGLQRVPLPEPMLTTSIRIEIVESFPGDTYDDLAVSELRLYGHQAVGADRTLARQTATRDG